LVLAIWERYKQKVEYRNYLYGVIFSSVSLWIKYGLGDFSASLREDTVQAGNCGSIYKEGGQFNRLKISHNHNNGLALYLNDQWLATYLDGSPLTGLKETGLRSAILILSPNPKGFRLKFQLKPLCKGLQLLASAALCKSAINNPVFRNP
jgi:hypothetical protein